MPRTYFNLVCQGYVTDMFLLPQTYQKYTITYHFWNKIYIPKKFPKHTILKVPKTYLNHTTEIYVLGTFTIPKTYQ